jgi:hypothetical protein
MTSSESSGWAVAAALGFLLLAIGFVIGATLRMLQSLTPGHVFKLLCLTSYAGLVGGLTLYAYQRSGSGPHLRVTRDIQPNERIEAKDLVAIDAAKIADHYARRGIAAGRKIAAADVDGVGLPLPASTVGVLLKIPRPEGGARIEAGDKLQLCLDKKPFGAPTAALASSCDAMACLVTIPVADWPKDVAVAGTAAKLSAVAATEAKGCGG